MAFQSGYAKMRKVEVTCDNCQRQLSDTGSMPAFRVVLKSEQIPSSSPYRNAVHIEPQVRDEQHFCGIDCLYSWLDKTYPRLHVT